MKMMNLVVAVLILTMATSSVMATQTLKLNTGYNHSLIVDAAYTPIPPATQDNYWIKVWSTAPGFPAPSWAIPVSPAWFPTPLPDSNWINVQNSNASTYPSNSTTPGYHIYRKCFCLQQGFKNATMNLDFRADDGVAIWFNSTWIQPFTAGNWWQSTPYTKTVNSGFRVGRNCMFVLIGDIGTYTGFNLAGSVTANGLLQTPAFGTAGTFQPCGCGGPAGGQAMRIGEDGDDDKKIIEEIVKSVKSNEKRNVEVMKKAAEMPRTSDNKN